MSAKYRDCKNKHMQVFSGIPNAIIMITHDQPFGCAFKSKKMSFQKDVSFYIWPPATRGHARHAPVANYRRCHFPLHPVHLPGCVHKWAARNLICCSANFGGGSESNI